VAIALRVHPTEGILILPDIRYCNEVGVISRRARVHRNKGLYISSVTSLDTVQSIRSSQTLLIGGFAFVANCAWSSCIFCFNKQNQESPYVRK